jgi:hypothetical protein
MYENETARVRLGIEFLQAMTEKDYLLDPTFDVLDLESKLNEIQEDINRLNSNLPVEAIDDDEEREGEYPGVFEDSEELEDEVVECEKLISQANDLLKAVREHYLPSEESSDSVSSSQASTSTSRKYRLSEDSRFRLFVVIIFAIVVIAYLIFGD